MKYIVTSLFLFACIICNAQNPADSMKKYCRYIGSDDTYQKLFSNQKTKSGKKIICRKNTFNEPIGFALVVEIDAVGLGIDLSEFSAVAWRYVSKQLHGEPGLLTLNPNHYNIFLINKEVDNRMLMGHVAVLWDGKQWVVIPIDPEKLQFPADTEFRIFEKEKVN